LPLWVVMTVGMDSWDFPPQAFFESYGGQGALELIAESQCEGDGYEAFITWTIPASSLPAGRYDLQARVDHHMNAMMSCRDDWSVLHIRINNAVVACHSMPCSLNEWMTELTLTVTLIRIRGDGTDMLTLSVSISGCQYGGTTWHDIVLTRSTTTVPPGPTGAPMATLSLAPTPMPMIPVFLKPWGPAIPQGAIEGWEVEMTQFTRGDDKYTYPFVQDDKLVVKLALDCFGSNADGVGMMVTGTIQGVPTGLYNVKMKMSHETYPWWDVEGAGGCKSGFIVNGQVLDTDTLVGFGSGIKQSNALTLSATNVALRGNGTDTITLYTRTNKCTNVDTLWDDIALMLTNTNASPAPMPAPLKDLMFLEDWSSSSTLSLWTMSLSQLGWPNEYKDPYVEQGKLVMYLGSTCDYSGVDDGVGMGFTRTLVGLLAGLYNVQVRVDYVLYIF